MTTTSDVNRLHERIDSLEDHIGNKMDRLSAEVVKIVTQCALCNRTVMGNGQRPIGERMTIVENAATVIPVLAERQREDHETLVKIVERHVIGWKAVSVIVAVSGVVFSGLNIILRYFVGA